MTRTAPKQASDSHIGVLAECLFTVPSWKQLVCWIFYAVLQNVTSSPAFQLSILQLELQSRSGPRFNSAIAIKTMHAEYDTLLKSPNRWNCTRIERFEYEDRVNSLHERLLSSLLCLISGEICLVNLPWSIRKDHSDPLPFIRQGFDKIFELRRIRAGVIPNEMQYRSICGSWRGGDSCCRGHG
jgi:hypothetical protein